MNPGDASRLRINQEMGEEWNRALHRESKSRPGTAQTCFPSHLRVESADPIRQRSNSTQSLSPMQTFPEVPASPTEQTCPITLPVRTSSRRVVDHPADADHQSHDEVDDSLVAVPEEEEDQHADGGIGYAVTTSEDTCFGETSIGVEKLLGLDMGEEEANALERTATSTNVPQIRETQSTPDLTVTAEDDMVYRPQMYLSVRPRPLSQLSQLSDTLNGSFIVPPSPIHGSRRRSKRISCRLSTHMKLNGSFTLDEATIDSWEEDIDWCYENEAEANCDFDWDHDLQNAAGNPNDEPQSFSPAPVLETAAFEIPIPKSELLEIPEEIKEETAEEELVINEKRITGLFEDRLLLPPSPRFPPSSFGGFPRARDSGFEGGNTDDQSMLMRAGNNALRHRSITTSTDLSMRSYREELFRVARQLDEHIAALNQELGGSPFNSPPMSPLSRPTVPDDISLFSGKRQRADSQTTCVTLCSDTDTITHFETHEVITPASSAHNSFHFTKQRASSVTGAGYAVEGRSEKGLSFPAAAIPGVVELGPGDFDALCAEEPEFVHFI
ncbi:hypothetical protein FN846DRAFT_601636 [Sphaerosporella brunnea]|uniref:Uncharacterized protein n=1 Tax=Sphaerosporella brunnea TaxID=1250544 RepID=A0A5J5EC13_9PEZI|nr:hypothetical protein FN846DRAFT_601636 [Sphaerosporella brunnea]